MKAPARIKEVYDGGFTERYLELHKAISGFVIKGTSYHYNAGVEKVLCEIHIPTTAKSTNDILNFIVDNRSAYPWANISPDEIRSNEDLTAFIEKNK